MLITSIYKASLSNFANETIIIDNLDAGCVLSGSWSSSGLGGFYGSNSVYANTNSANATATFTPNLLGGQYEVAAWWPNGSASNSASDAPYDVVNAAGATTVTVDQTTNGGKWNILGTFTFSAGTAGYVRIRNNTTNRSARADAVRFVRISA